jgi:hypothetical protein
MYILPFQEGKTHPKLPFSGWILPCFTTFALGAPGFHQVPDPGGVRPGRLDGMERLHAALRWWPADASARHHAGGGSRREQTSQMQKTFGEAI